jgi:surface antigen
VSLIVAALLIAWQVQTRTGAGLPWRLGEVIDQRQGVKVYYNGHVGHVAGRHLTADGYNLGLKYQCVEFVKRYYYERFGHKMPDAMGHAKDFFDRRLADGQLNPARNLVQHANGGSSPPQVDDLIVFDAHPLNPYGHVAIVSEVGPDDIEIVQQNPGPYAATRERIALTQQEGRWQVQARHTLGWLRRAAPEAPAAAAGATRVGEASQ